MEEKEIWSGTPSQWTNFSIFASSIILITIPWAFWSYLVVRTWKIRLTNQRLIEQKGVLSKTTNELELYRVKDIKVSQPFFLRLVGLSNIILATSDRTNPTVIIPAIKNAMDIKEKLRVAVDDRRDQKGVRETDFIS